MRVWREEVRPEMWLSEKWLRKNGLSGKEECWQHDAEPPASSRKFVQKPNSTYIEKPNSTYIVFLSLSVTSSSSSKNTLFLVVISSQLHKVFLHIQFKLLFDSAYLKNKYNYYYWSTGAKPIEANPHAKRLYDDLLSNYNRLIRPVANNTDKLTVLMGLKLAQLTEVVKIDYYNRHFKKKGELECFIGKERNLTCIGEVEWIEQLVLC